MFGHVAQMPQILRRAGLADAVVWRGVPAAVDRHAFRWESPDGSWVRAEYLSAGYGNAAGMFVAPDALDAAGERFLDWAAPWFGDDPVLAMYGTDHTAPVPELAALVSRLNEVHAASDMRISTLAQYLEAAPGLAADDPCWRGEMRSGARANVLMGVASARIDIKQAAGRAETLLERYAEPLSALHVAPDAWPYPFLRLAWGKVIENSAHDSICGCSIDPVVGQVLVRFAEAEQIATSLSRRAAAAVAAAVPRGALAVLNPTPAARTGLIEAELLVPEEWTSVALEVPDGSRIATQELARKASVLFDDTVRGHRVGELFRRFHGREVFDHAWNGYQLDGRAITLLVDTDADPPWLDVDALRSEVTAAMLAGPDEDWRIRIIASPRRTLAASLPMPALGWTAVRAVEGAGSVSTGVRAAGDGRTLSNGLLSVAAAADGTLRLAAEDGTTVEGVGQIVEGGDVGDSYNYGPPPADLIVERPTHSEARMDLTGPVRGRLRITRTYEWPRGATAECAARTAEVETVEVVTEAELRAGEPFARIAIAFENRSDDHRVRFHAPLPRRAAHSHAEGQFAVVERGLSGEGGYEEEPLATFPAHGWVDAGGLAILLDHLSEYELTDDGRELALTVLRSTGLISRNDNPYRQDPAGPQLAIPDAQMRGPWRMTFGLLPHSGDWVEAGVAKAAEQYRHDPVVSFGNAPADATWPPPGAADDGLALDGSEVELASLRRRDADWLEARVVNLAGEPRTANLRGDILEARRATLRGEPGEALEVIDGGVKLALGPAEIATIQLRRRETAAGRAEVLDAAGPRQSI
jgi:alpha-mannosidase